MSSHLGDADRLLWERVTGSVTPLGERRAARVPSMPLPSASSHASTRPPPTPSARSPGTVQLDGGWERRLVKGVVEPDRTLDLHGLRLDAAWERLDGTLARMVAGGERVLLVIAGRDRGPDVRHQPGARGRIRAKLPDWLESGAHANRIAAVRPAHARHGGAGAVYVVLRRTRAAGGAVRAS